MPERDMDEPVNVDMNPEDALRVLLGEEKRKEGDELEADEEPEADTGES
jgi:hypothetical protein